MRSPERTIETLQIGMSASRSYSSGTDRYFQELLRELPAQGIGVRGMVIGDPQGIENPMHGVDSFAQENSGRIARIRGARKVADKLVAGTDLIVSHGAPHASYILDKLGTRPLIAHFHGPWALEGRAEGIGFPLEMLRRAQESFVYRRARRYIALSRAFANTLQSEYGVDPENVRVIPGGVDLNRFELPISQSEARALLSWPENRPIVLATRRLEPTKGLASFIDAIARVRAAVPDVLAILSGTGSLAEALRARVEDLGLGDSVRFLGHVENALLPIMYRAADYSIVPSSAWEGFGLSVLESLAAGTPAIVTPVGGLPEVVGNLCPELVLADFSVDSLATGMTRLLQDRTIAPSRDACVAYARQFSWRSIARQVASIYREVV